MAEWILRRSAPQNDSLQGRDLSPPPIRPIGKGCFAAQRRPAMTMGRTVLGIRAHWDQSTSRSLSRKASSPKVFTFQNRA